MDASKIQLSADEWQLVQNSAWILTKHAVIGKVYHLFGQLAHEVQASLQRPHGLPPEALHLSPKISKGEQYRRLPWVVLDYPRHFSREHVLAIRQFFWWGHYFSTTLQLKGRFQQELAPAIMQAALAGKLAGHYWSAGGDEFNFDVREGYTAADKQLPTEAQLQNGSFVKLTILHPFEEWNEMPARLLQASIHFITMVDR